MEILQRYSWPGNVRELENGMERAALLVGPENIVPHRHLPEQCRSRGEEDVGPRPEHLPQKLDNLEREYLESALKASRGNLKKAAASLGITERMIGPRAKKRGLDYRDFRREGN